MALNAFLLALLQSGPVAYLPGPVVPGEKMLQAMPLRMQVDALGKPSAIECEPDVPASFCARLLSAAPAWAFAPGQIDGRPAAFRVRATVRLRATPAENGYAIRASSVTVADLDGPVPVSAAVPAPPPMPVSALRRGGGYVVEVAYHVPAGERRATVTEVWVNGKQNGDAVHGDIARAARTAVRALQFSPGDGRIANDCMLFTMSTGGAMPVPQARDCQRQFAAGYQPPTLRTAPGDMVF